MPISLTERDLEILNAINNARYMTAPQIQALFWRSSRGGKYGNLKSCQRRLQQLTQHGLVRRIKQLVKRGEGSRPHIYALDRAGAQILSDEIGIDPSELDWRPKNAEENYPFMQHLLDTNDFRIALTLACEDRNVFLVSWTDEKELKKEEAYDHVFLTGPSGGTQKVAVIPDASFVIGIADRQGRFCVEIDRGTVTVSPTAWQQRGWTQKIRAYLEYYQSGAYERRYQTRSFRVLTVTTSEERLQNMRKATEEVGGDARFWFTTFEQVKADTILTEKVWYRAVNEGAYSLLG